jgi:short-subunit dehydrogenase
MTTNIFISGATSAMAQAFARLYAPKGAQFFLVGRSVQKLQFIKQDLQVRGAKKIVTVSLDMAQPQDYEKQVADAIREFGSIEIALIAQGVMHPQAEAQGNPALVREMLQVNVLSAIETANALGNYFEKIGKGALLVISSVAGDRGRQSNYLYGATKAALSVYSDGLRNRLGKKGITVVTVKPGFVDTPMTVGLDTSGPLWATPEKVANDMARAIEKHASVLYTPWFWRYIMLVIKHIPEFIFKKLSL